MIDQAPSRCFRLALPFLLIVACGRRASEAGPPLVSITVPSNAATEIAVDVPITAQFSQPMDPATVNGTTFLLRQAGIDVPSAVVYLADTAILTPTLPLTLNTAYTATITAGSMSAAGSALVGPYSWSFTTLAAGPLPDVSATIPINAAVNVSSRQPLNVTFSEAMDPSTLTPSTFTVSQGRASVAGQVSYNAESDTATFTPNMPLGASLPYDAQIETGAKSAEGRGLVAPLSWTFTTRPPGMGPAQVVGPARMGE
jgi:hypothetical protein